MIITTTNSIEGRRILIYHGVVTGQTIVEASIFRDLFATIRDVVGGRSGCYDRMLRDARDEALAELAAEAEARGVRINALGVGSDSAVAWLRENAATAGGFVMQASDWHDVARALRGKITLELAAR
jgi:uncharacterized protein YbjQ (UPF0145 family)